MSVNRLPRFVRASPSAALGFGLGGVLVFLMLATPWIAPSDPLAIEPGDKLQGPSFAHLLGTDSLGRDSLSRLLWGGRVSLGAAAVALAASFALALALGGLAGYLGGAIDSVVSGLSDAMLALPGLIPALAIVGTLGPGLHNLILAMALVHWAGPCRVVRSLVRGLRDREHVLAARATGAGQGRIIVRHVLPLAAGPIAAMVALDFGGLLLTISGFGFLGLGVEPPNPEWGVMLAESRIWLDRAPLLSILPGLAIASSALAAHLVGEAIGDLADPRRRQLKESR